MTNIPPTTRRRIERAVRRIERMPVGNAGARGGVAVPGGLPIVLLVAQEDIEHGESGSCKRAAGTPGEWSAVPSDLAREVVNLRDKIWLGSLVLATWGSWKVEGGTGGESVWAAMQAWSATRIRGLAAANIAPGATGTLNSVKALNGHYANTDASVFLPTAHVQVKAGKVCWAELVYYPTGSRWEAYSADCDGTE